MTDYNDFFKNFDPKDIADLQARAEKIEEKEGLFYQIHMTVPYEGAVEFIETYKFALTGDLFAMSSLMAFAAMVAQSLMISIDQDGDEDD
jgi:hypothetical protein